eukprot:768772-Hanusia_phi.AAC.18
MGREGSKRSRREGGGIRKRDGDLAEPLLAGLLSFSSSPPPATCSQGEGGGGWWCEGEMKDGSHHSEESFHPPLLLTFISHVPVKFRSQLLDGQLPELSAGGDKEERESRNESRRAGG